MGSFGACRTHTAWRQKNPVDPEMPKSSAPDLKNMPPPPPKPFRNGLFLEILKR